MTGRPDSGAVDRPVGARRSHVEFKVWCTDCGAELLVLSKRRGAREPWRLWSMTGCPHVTREQVETWRYTRRDARASLELPVRTSTGAPGPRVPARHRGRRSEGTNPRARGTNPRAQGTNGRAAEATPIESFRADVATSLIEHEDGQADT